jgi:cell division protein FtsL
MLRPVPHVRNRHLVRQLHRGRLKELLMVAVLVAVLLLPLLGYVWNHMEWIRVGYEMERLKRERLAQAELGERLRIERASLASLARVEGEARDRLGLVPASGAVVAVNEDPPGSIASVATQGSPPAEPSAASGPGLPR